MIDLLIIARGHPDQVASTRYRVAAFLPYLEEEGIKFRMVIPPARRKACFFLWPVFYAEVLFFGFKAKTILVQKDIFLLVLWRLFKRAGKRIVYDFDDAIYYKGHRGEKHVYFVSLRKKEPAKMVSEMVALADHVIVANQRLFQFARRFSKSAEVLPMAVAPASFPLRARENRHPVTIGWIGSPITASHLAILEVPLGEICRRYRQRVRIKIVTSGSVPLNGVVFEHHVWTKDDELDHLYSFDIGLVPLRMDDEVAASKSSYKLLQFMAAGLPTVSSSLGFNNEVIQTGVNGFLAANIQQWIGALETLVVNVDLRWRMGSAARATVESSFALEKIAARWMEIVPNCERGDIATESEKITPNSLARV